ncbi:ATP-dependent nuclease [Amycolatopsis tucumanensis]|uniref:AAA+ ATPase domain-containing protein n=1 Tax=Amycolatopsis tucumanensis TaxID=401106 RepID=A0ABP7JEL6_9PSEU|nr:AAA family ATPase [Amycolatopsis tucumanensis]MCF6426037.1 ATP-binding protein [Amycolatopsis tucumanensis]
MRSVTLTSGKTISLTDGITAIVGPNNAGKSLLLRELQTLMNSQHGVPAYLVQKVVESYDVEFKGSFDEVAIPWIEKRARRRPPGQYNNGAFVEDNFSLLNGGAVTESSLRTAWEQRQLGPLAQVYQLYFGADGRTGMVGNTGAYSLAREEPSNPVQRLYADEALERTVSKVIERAFQTPLYINRAGGSEISVHLGTMINKPTIPPTSEFLDELKNLPLLQDQGDGIRAFVSIMLTIITGQYGFVMIDEPEVFLHPPQAYLLGKMLAERHDEGTQVLLATHSEEVIQGLTSSKAASRNVSIVRLTREGSVNHAAQVSPERVADLANDPVVKHFAILRGLFYEGVVVCESDGDCTYYRAALEAARQDGVSPQERLLFCHCNGKARMYRMVESVRDTKVPVACIVDIDFLQNDNDFTRLLNAYGESAEDFAAPRNIVSAAVEQLGMKIDRSVAKMKINEILAAKNSSTISRGEVDRITEVVAPQSGWKLFKRGGKRLLSGDAAVAFNQLDEKLREIGIFIVAEGELERFHPEVPAKTKASWLQIVLEEEKYRNSPSAIQLTLDVSDWISLRQ